MKRLERLTWRSSKRGIQQPPAERVLASQNPRRRFAGRDVMIVMLRYAAMLRPTLVTLVGSLSVAAVTATALSLFHDLDASVMILIWNVGISAKSRT